MVDRLILEVSPATRSLPLGWQPAVNCLDTLPLPLPLPLPLGLGLGLGRGVNSETETVPETMRESRQSRFVWLKADTRNAFGVASPSRAVSAKKIAENNSLDNQVLANQSAAHAERIANFRRAKVDSARKFGLIKAFGNKRPKAVQAVESAAKAAKRRVRMQKS
jgi:hypothetical protein